MNRAGNLLNPPALVLFLRLMMVTTSVQDRTAEFRTVLAQAQKRKSSAKVGAQRQSLLTDSQRREANGSPNGESNGPRKGARSEFARKAAEIGRGITGTMEKLERLAQCTYTLRVVRVGYRVGTLYTPVERFCRCADQNPRAVAKRKTLFDDRPVEIAELTYVIKQDLSSLNSQISSLQSLSKSQQAQVNRKAGGEQEGEHNKNVCFNSGHRSEDVDTESGCCSITRQIGRRRFQFQRGPRSANEKHPSLALTDGKLCLFSIISFTAFT